MMTIDVLRAPYVWIMLVGDPSQVFVKVLLAGCADVSDVSKRACADFGWGAPTQCRLYLVREGRARALAVRDDPSLAADILIRANELDPDEPVVAGSWLLARVPMPLTAAAAAVSGDIEALTAAIARLESRLEAAPVSIPHINFSKASATFASRAAAALGIRSGGGLLVDLSAFMPPTGRHAAIVPFVWRAGRGERAESAALLTCLESWVTVNAAPPIDNAFFDVQNFTTDPIIFEVEDVAEFRGMVDAIIVTPQMRRIEELAPITSSALVCVDWKTPAALAVTGKIAAIAHIQAFAFAARSGGRAPPPIIMTDMATGFRCWVVIDSVLYYLHPASRDLSLAEGVALIRLFLARLNAGHVPCAVGDALSFRGGAERWVVQGGSGSGAAGGGMAGGGGVAGSLAGGETETAADANASSTACSRAAERPLESVSAYGLLSPAGTVGDDGEDDSPETVIQQVAVALSGGGGFKIPF
jgi:hypothetical protein